MDTGIDNTGISPQRPRWMSGLILVLASLLVPISTQAAGLLTPASGGDALTLEEQHVEVVVESGFTVTSVEQRFSNPHAYDLDALYRFPIPHGAAVGEFTYWIDDQAVHAEIMQKQAARQLHDSERTAGRETALVEQDGYKNFDMSVSPVRANDDVRVRLVYLQETAIDYSIGRYAYPLESGGTDEQGDSFWSRNEHVEAAFSFRMRIRSGYPIDAVRVPNGQAVINDLGNGEWEVLIDSSTGNGASTGDGLDDASLRVINDVARIIDPDIVERLPSSPVINSDVSGNAHGPAFLKAENVLNNASEDNYPPSSPIVASNTAPAAWTLERDIIVYWRLAKDLPGAVDLVTYRKPGATQGSFMLTITPGVDLAPITEGRDWLFVLDTSGSMAGKFHTLADGVSKTIQALKTGDRFRVITFSDKARSLSRGYLEVNEANVRQALDSIRNLSAGGGTNLFDGLGKALRSLDDDRTSSVVLVTDGVANVGPTQMSRFLELLEPYDVRLFTAVMGNQANRPLLEGLTQHSAGFAIGVSNDDDLPGLIRQIVSKVTHQSMHNVDVKVDGVDVVDLEPAEFRRVYRGEQLVLSGTYRGAGQAEMTLDVDISGERQRYRSALSFAAEDTTYPELQRLVAFAQIRALQAQQDVIGETDDSRQHITQIALEHGLVTPYTSLLVVREEVFAAEGIERTNAARVDRERAARASRATSPVVSHKQDAAAPTFPGTRATTSSSGGSGSFGLWLLAIFGVLAAIRLILTVSERRD